MKLTVTSLKIFALEIKLTSQSIILAIETKKQGVIKIKLNILENKEYEVQYPSLNIQEPESLLKLAAALEYLGALMSYNVAIILTNSENFEVCLSLQNSQKIILRVQNQKDVALIWFNSLDEDPTRKTKEYLEMNALAQDLGKFWLYDPEMEEEEFNAIPF